MPWLSIIMALLSFFASMKSTKGDIAKSVLTAGLVGAGTYAVTHGTEWGRETLGSFDGVVPSESVVIPATAGTDPEVAMAGGAVLQNKGVNANTSGWDVLKTWGPTGVATVAGAVGIATGAIKTDWLLYGAIAVGAYFLLK